MKIIYFIFFVVFQLSGATLFAQDIDKYVTSRVPGQFEILFKNDEDKTDFKKLREFLHEKQDLLEALKSSLASKDNAGKENTTTLIRYQSNLKVLMDSIAKKKPEDSIAINPRLLNGTISPPQTTAPVVMFKVPAIQKFISEYKERISDLQQDTSRLGSLNSNISEVKNDIYKTQSQIDSALAPEYKRQSFRVTISICFSALIGILLVVFFYIIYKRSDANISKDLLSGNGLQFVTLFVLIIAVILFGILGILQSSELAAILSGISGYILGKGTQKDLAKTISAGKDTHPS